MSAPTAGRSMRACVIATMLLVAGCGGGTEDRESGSVGVDDAFVTRIVPHQHAAAALANTAATKADGRDVRRLARSMRAMRRRTLPAFDDHLARISATAQPSDLGVSAEQAADEVTPAALDSARPFDPAFLTVMTRHNRGALALVAAELERGRDPAVKAAAQRLGAELTRELARLTRLLTAVARRQRDG